MEIRRTKIMKVKGNGKEYVYDYKMIYLGGKEHKKLMEMSKKHNLSAARMINKLMNHYEDIHNNSI
jgi:hypothetical protein